MDKPRVLIIADKFDMSFLDADRESKYWDITWEVQDYNKLRKNILGLKEIVERKGIDFVLYSRNDQVAGKISIGAVTGGLGTGYSSFSGIDEEYRIEEMKACFKDFMTSGSKLNINRELEIDRIISDGNGGTFSLIFDTEQLGGVRFGLPRILNLLDRYQANSTFFCHRAYEDRVSRCTG
ncbi:hypothetical protein ACFLV9_00190 [Chloroflexota bacterium]